MSKQLTFFSVVAFQVLILFAIILIKFTVLTQGTVVFLQIEPVDPRDPFRGDYATFNYTISRLDSYLVKDKVKTGDTVYVSLRESGKYSYATGASLKKPTTGSVSIKGTVVSGSNFQSTVSYSPTPIIVKYGIEDFFIPEGSGTNLGRNRVDNYYSEVAVDDNGNAVLKKVYKNDIPINTR